MNYNIQKQHEKKKYHAVERIKLLFDSNSFYEVGSGITRREGEEEVPYDGVITGYGIINGKCVYVFAQDFTLKGGSIGLYHGRKIAHIIKKAIESKCPVIGIYDSGGARITEGIDALAGCGEMMYYNTLASGYIPQISIILGPCAGAAVYSPAITDFIFCVNKISNMYITGPKVIESVTGEKCTLEELGGAKVHAEVSGVVHVLCNNEKDCFKKVRQLIDYLPAYYCEESEKKIDIIKYNTISSQKNEILNLIKDTYDVKAVINQIIDPNSFFEIHEKFATSLVVGFGKICNVVVGIVANQPARIGILDCDSSDKGARFIRFCDSFNIPIISFVDTSGYLPGVDQEHNGIIRHGAKLLFAYAESSNIKITIILKKAYGGAYIAMGSKHLGTDYVYALPGAEIAVMGAEGAVKIIEDKRLKEVEPLDYDRLYHECVNKYREKFINADIAIAQGYVDEVIQPENLKKRIIYDLFALSKKKKLQPVTKKHSNIPL